VLCIEFLIFHRHSEHVFSGVSSSPVSCLFLSLHFTDSEASSCSSSSRRTTSHQQNQVSTLSYTHLNLSYIFFDSSPFCLKLFKKNKLSDMGKWLFIPQQKRNVHILQHPYNTELYQIQLCTFYVSLLILH